MHYYNLNIGDYASHAGHLTVIEDCAYRRLLDKYYLSETPLPLDVAATSRIIGMREYQSEVEIVLSEFFVRIETGWINKRADKEIAAYKAKSEQASRAGKASAQRMLNARTTDVQPNINHKPINNKQETSKTKEPKARYAIPDFVPQDAWDGFVQMRRTGKGVFTERAASLILKQLEAMQADGQDVAAVLDQSTANGWKGVFPLKQQNGAKNGKFNGSAENNRRLNELIAIELESAMAQGIVGSGVA